MNYDLEDIMSEQSKSSNIGCFRYSCNSCQCDFLSKKILNNCPICGDNVSECSDKKMDFLNSLEVIPFSKNMDEALKDYKKKVIHNPLSPFIFRRKRTLKNMKKLYLLCNLYNLKLSGSVKFAAIDNCEVVKDKKKSNEKKKYEILINSNFDYKNVFGSYFTKINDLDIDNVCNYNCNNLIAWDNLEDIVAILGDLREDEVLNKVRDRCMETSINIIRNDIKHETKKLVDNKLETNLDSWRFVLVPIYLLSVKYKGKDYVYLMNGETGVSLVDVPFGKIELIIFSVILFLFIFLIAFLVAYFL